MLVPSSDDPLLISGSSPTLSGNKNNLVLHVPVTLHKHNDQRKNRRALKGTFKKWSLLLDTRHQGCYSQGACASGGSTAKPEDQALSSRYEAQSKRPTKSQE
eukprot:2621787-Amphidinium_carterae.1